MAAAATWAYPHEFGVKRPGLSQNSLLSPGWFTEWPNTVPPMFGPRRLSSSSFARRPLVRRITGYSAGSVVAVVISEACFAIAYGWGHRGTTLASAAGFVGGAVPNYILNRRWAWRDRRGRNRRTEILLYTVVAVASFVVSAVVTHWAEVGARQHTAVRDWQVALITAAYLGVSGIFFVVKFVIYETVVFRAVPAREAAADVEPQAAAAATPPAVR